ncbi:VENN motif pre-toxin domain-containing protein [uncultured Gilliamella sp.]|uniref:VENN motif pre-toxin domain-containing protein n=2 Tax=Gilliamella TaxID=1193503 RepID=UPI0025F38AA3|nr:VENN motif pre-toxin domain-containing protein [uncultured Gilliamella sp.]
MAGEVAADIIRKQLYGKEVKDLTEEEKETISALSQLASGLAVAAGGGNIGDASTAISSKNAVENNSVGPWHGGDIIGLSPETGANYDSIVHASAAGYLTLEEAFQIIDDMNSGKYMYDPLREDLKRFPEDLAILVTPYGDYIAFRDADSWGDYAIAIAGVLPFVKYIKVAGKVVKVETIAAQALVKEAEAAYKAGNVAEGNRLMNQVASQSTQVETTVIRQAHSSNAGKGTTGTTSNGYIVSNGADTVIAKTDLDHPIVQSRINVQKAGWDHVVDRHFSDKNASQFTISQSELKTILQSNEVSKVPISRVIDSADGPRYERVITFDKHIGVDKFSKSPTNTMTILTDAKGNLITTTPGRIK